MFIAKLLFISVTVTAAVAAHAADKVFEITVKAGVLTTHPKPMQVDKGDAVRLRVKSNAPGVIHLHGYRLELAVAADQPAELSFKAHATGRYPLEWHGASEGAQARAHHGPAATALEVRPQ